MLEQITPLILTYNEAPNIERTLEQLNWAKEIVIIDSYSEDNTIEILQKYPQVQVDQRQFDNHTNQWNYGLEKITSEWVLSLDADYVLSSELIQEIDNLGLKSNIDGYFVRFKYCIHGKKLRGTLYPPRQVLFRKGKSIFIDDGHTQLIQVNGNFEMLSAYIYHDDRKPLDAWLKAQNNYMIIESKKILETPDNQLSLGDKLRKKKVIAPLIVLFYCLIIKGGIFDGWAGWYYAWQRTLAEILLAIRIIELEKLKN
jgi:glycosyltransferase involved in cell wall biosynthesis